MAPQPAKRPASQNALKHGLASGTILIPGEDPAELQALETALFKEYKPSSPTETLLVGDMVKHHWLKDRAIRLQGEALAAAQPGELPATFPVLLRYQTTNERAFHKALAVLLTLRKEKDKLVSQEEANEIFRKIHIPFPSFSDTMARIEEMKKRREKEGV